MVWFNMQLFNLQCFLQRINAIITIIKLTLSELHTTYFLAIVQWIFLLDEKWTFKKRHNDYTPLQDI